jgi:hypothetical protein
MVRRGDACVVQGGAPLVKIGLQSLEARRPPSIGRGNDRCEQMPLHRLSQTSRSLILLMIDHRLSLMVDICLIVDHR